jgi:hypothetical protein
MTALILRLGRGITWKWFPLLMKRESWMRNVARLLWVSTHYLLHTSQHDSHKCVCLCVCESVARLYGFKMKDELERIWKKWLWPYWGTILTCAFRNWGKSWKTLVTIAGVPAEMWTKPGALLLDQCAQSLLCIKCVFVKWAFNELTNHTNEIF